MQLTYCRTRGIQYGGSHARVTNALNALRIRPMKYVLAQL